LRLFRMKLFVDFNSAKNKSIQVISLLF